MLKEHEAKEESKKRKIAEAFVDEQADSNASEEEDLKR